MKHMIVLLAGLLLVAGCRCPMMCHEEGSCPFPGVSGPAKSAVNAPAPIDITTVVKSATLKDGILARVEMTNKGEAPFVLSVCPAMELCCVKGLHPMVDYDETGVGLLDLCKVAKPTPQSVFLPVGAAFAFDITIPVSHLPDNVVKAGKEMTIYFCYDGVADRLLESNRVKTRLE